MAQGAPSFPALVFLIAVVVVGGSVGGVLVYEHNTPKPIAAPPTVHLGANVTVNYIGLYGSGGDQGRVFDTSLKSVADDNASWPKAVQYSPRNASGYTPLGVHVGPHAPTAGYSVNGTTFGGVVTGFWEGILGLAVNQTRSVTIPAPLAYGPLNTSCLRYAPLVTTVPSLVLDSPGQFDRAYPGMSAFAGTSFVDPTYGWIDTVVSANSSAIVVQQHAVVGATTSHKGWPVVVTNVTAQQITLENELGPSNVGRVAGNASPQVCGANAYIVSAVNPNGTYTENFNREVVGETLIFVITLVAIATP